MSTEVQIERREVNERSFVIATLSSSNGVNALSSETVASLRRTVHDMGAEGGGHALILRAEGRCFSAGADVKEFRGFSADDFRQSMRNIADLFLEMLECPRPIVSVVHADAIGGGAAVAFCSDYIIAAETAKFSLPEVHRGLAGLGYLLPRLIGRHRAGEMTLLGRSFAASRMHEWGLVNEVCAGSELDERDHALRAELAVIAGSGFEVAKRSLSCGMQMPLREGVQAHIDAQAAAFERFRQGGPASGGGAAPQLVS